MRFQRRFGSGIIRRVRVTSVAGFFYHLGYSQVEIPRNDEEWRELLHPGDRQAQSVIGRSAELSDQALEMEFRVQSKHGGYVDVQSRGKVVERDAAGSAVLWRGTLRDFTTQKQVEAEFRKLSEAVEHSPSMATLNTSIQNLPR